jgi:hypothetical protein
MRRSVAEPERPAQCLSCIYLGLDVHKDSVTIAVLPTEASAPTQVDRLPNDPRKLRPYLARRAEQGALHCCYEASGAGYVFQRLLTQWGYRSLALQSR